MIAAPVFNTDALCLSSRRRPQKRLNRNSFGHSMQQLGDDLLFLTRLFNATPPRPREGASPGQDVKNPCLISFDLFRPSFGAGLIHERLSVRLSLHTNDMHKICSNMCIMLKSDTTPPNKESVIRLSTASYNAQGSHPTTLTNSINVFFHHDDIMYTSKRFYIVLDVYKLADSDNDNVRDLNANECRDDGLKSKYTEKVRVPNGEGKLDHLLMVGAKHIEFEGNFSLRLS